MSMVNTTSGRLSADDRYELAAIAQNQERLNYPKHLIFVGLMLVGLALIIFIVGWRMRSSALKANSLKAVELASINELIDELNTLEATQANDPDQDLYQPIPDIFSRLERFATQAKLENKLVLPSGRRNTNRSRPITGNARQMLYPYTIRDSSLEHMLDWIKISTEQIAGLEVTDLEIKPAKQNWTMTVTLSRYERTQ